MTRRLIGIVVVVVITTAITTITTSTTTTTSTTAPVAAATNTNNHRPTKKIPRNVRHYDFLQFADCVDLLEDCPRRASVGECHFPMDTNNDVDDSQRKDYHSHYYFYNHRHRHHHQQHDDPTTVYARDAMATARYIQAHCPVSCRVCGQHHQIRSHTEAFSPPPRKHPAYHTPHDIIPVLAQEWGVPQWIIVPPSPSPPTESTTIATTTSSLPPTIIHLDADPIAQTVNEAVQYMTREVLTEPRYAPVREKCQNRHPLCAYWVTYPNQDPTPTTVCDSHREFMMENCTMICQLCDELDERVKCPWEERNLRNAWYPGDLHAMFQRIVQKQLPPPPSSSSSSPPISWNITVLSRPRDDKEHDDDEVDDETDEEEDHPWVLLIDNFLSPAEAERLRELGTSIGFERSEEVESENEDAISDRRTSDTAWCDTEECYNDPLVLAIWERMEWFTGIPAENSESLQLLHYRTGAFYDVHHDYIGHEVDRRQGVRILTVFFYLNDEGLLGGGTHFPELDITVKPVKGRALLWPNVYNDDPHERDPRTYHEALPVEGGTKYGANAWFHQRKYHSDC